MLSILIPVYNQNVSKLVTQLVEQCNKAKITFEIVLFDDKSKDKYRLENRRLAGLFNVSYLELSENYGRAKIRNLLGKNARYENLLFLDCDSKLTAKKFIKNYAPYLETHDVIYGGRIYPKKKPKAGSKLLHWKYGRKREALPAKQRMKKPYLRFQSNNFIIKRSLFLKIKFHDGITKYGFEDLVFAKALKDIDIPICHIENPIRHAGLVSTDVFLKKQADAIDNLILLVADKKIVYTTLYSTYLRLKQNKLLKLFMGAYPKIEASIFKSLHSSNPNLYYLDMWKLYNLANKLK